MGVGNWSIRSKIAAMVSTPLIATTTLWGFSLALTAGPAVHLLRFRTLAQDVAPRAEALVTELQRERRVSLVFLAGRASLPALDRQRQQTDGAVAAVRRLTALPAAREALGPRGRQRVAALLRAVDGLPRGRARVDRRELDRTGAAAQYTAVVETALRLLPAAPDVADDALAGQARALVDLARARELLAREDALVSAALTGGRFVDDEARAVIQLVGMRRARYADAAAGLPDTGRAAYRTLVTLPEFGRLRAMEDALLARGRAGERPPLDARHWDADCRAVSAAARAFEQDQAAAVAGRVSDLATGVLVRLALAGLLGLAALVATLVISVRVARTVVGRLHRLRDTARVVADQRLPDIVARLRRGEPVDIDAASPDLVDGDDEIGELAGAFGAVHRTAVRAAVDEATFRRGTSAVFRNIARRSQTLLHRQLALLDQMERGTTDPDVLADLFRIDHLATRLRRHAEDLVVLAGAAPGRGWREPVPLVDVLRGAVSEVEEYARVDVQADPPAALVGRAVSDVIHLLAELVENATTFSPRRSRVRIAVQDAPAGLAVEIEDRGLGMPAAALAEWNARLAVPPEFDPTASARLGLFVVARLAARHAIP
ncbi:MAG TPA: nitrate- and nitrite sensing domain-containing protein, partial [Pilimelia sp.]|nr:nitrate- and nitrite sensing domain-containing protein [Pilimelia sp.]